MLAQLATDMIKNLKKEVTCRSGASGESTHHGCAIGCNENCNILASGAILFNQHLHFHPPSPSMHAGEPGGMSGGGGGSSTSDSDDSDDNGMVSMVAVGKPRNPGPDSSKIATDEPKKSKIPKMDKVDTKAIKDKAVKKRTGSTRASKDKINSTQKSKESKKAKKVPDQRKKR